MADLKGKPKVENNDAAIDSEITSVIEFLEKLKSFTPNIKKLTSNYLYRGLPNSHWEIQSTDNIRFDNAEKDEVPSYIKNYAPITGRQLYNQSLVQYFKHEFSNDSQNMHTLNSELAILAQLRHYNAATALIDFSGSPLIALWFACQEHQEETSINQELSNSELAGKKLYYKENTDGKIFILDIADEDNFVEIHDNEQLKKYSIETLYHSQNLKKWFYWRPSHLNKRIPAQSSYFVVGQNTIPKDKIKEIVIPHHNKKDILKELASTHSIDILTLFPDMHGFAAANAYNQPYSTKLAYRTLMRFYDTEIESAREANIDIQRTRGQNTHVESLSNLYLCKGFIKLELNLLGEAVQDFDQAIDINNKNYNAFIFRSFSKFQLENNMESIRDCNQAINLDPKKDIAYSLRGLAKYQLEKYSEATKDFDKAINLKPENADLYNDRGLAKASIGDHQKAIKDYDKAIELDPKNSQAYHNRGFSKFTLEKNIEAIEDIDKAINLKPENADLYNHRGLAKASKGDHQEAIKDYDKAIELDPKNSQAYHNRGLSKFALEKNIEAIEDIDKAIELDPGDAKAYNNRGFIKGKLGKYDEALFDVNRSLEIDPDNKSFRESIKEIKKMRRRKN